MLRQRQSSIPDPPIPEPQRQSYIPAAPLPTAEPLRDSYIPPPPTAEPLRDSYIPAAPLPTAEPYIPAPPPLPMPIPVAAQPPVAAPPAHYVPTTPPAPRPEPEPSQQVGRRGTVIMRPSMSSISTEAMLALAGASAELPKLSEWQHLWLGMQSRRWSSLCLVPASRVKSDVLVRVANGLCRIGIEHLKQSITVFDHRGITLGDVEWRIGEMSSALSMGSKVIVVIDAIEQNPVSARYASAQVTDAALLAFVLGSSEMSGARKTVEAFGKDRFLGSVALRSEGSRSK